MQRYKPRVLTHDALIRKLSYARSFSGRLRQNRSRRNAIDIFSRVCSSDAILCLSKLTTPSAITNVPVDELIGHNVMIFLHNVDLCTNKILLRAAAIIIITN